MNFCVFSRGLPMEAKKFIFWLEYEEAHVCGVQQNHFGQLDLSTYFHLQIFSAHWLFLCKILI